MVLQVALNVLYLSGATSNTFLVQRFLFLKCHIFISKVPKPNPCTQVLKKPFHWPQPKGRGCSSSFIPQQAETPFSVHVWAGDSFPWRENVGFMFYRTVCS